MKRQGRDFKKKIRCSRAQNGKVRTADRLVGPMAAAAAAGYSYSTTRMGVYRDLEYEYRS